MRWNRSSSVRRVLGISLPMSLVALSAACGFEPGQVIPASVDPEMIEAMQRDLGQDLPQVMRRLSVEARAAQLEPSLRAELGETFAGVWMNGDGSGLVVGVTDAAQADRVRALGGEPRLVDRSLAELEDVKAVLDAAGPSTSPSVHAWYVDTAGNRVVIEAEDAAAADVDNLIALLPQDGTVEIRVADASDRPVPLYDLRGGDEYIINSNTLCSVGFAVNGGFVTAGHCGGAGSPTAGSNWVAQGTFAGSIFPGSDMAYVAINGNWSSLPFVKTSGGGQVGVAGSNIAAVGSSVCRSGRTTGWRCGTIQAHNVTINYSAGPVYGATQTSACAEGGDSGGSFISGNQAQGVTSGGSGNCSSGGTTFYQPINPILSKYGVSLKTEGGGGAKEVVSNMNGKCIDVPGAKFDDGARLQMWDCNGTVAQKWTFTGGTLRAGGKCMDVAGANPGDGTAIQLVSCNGNLAQQFVLSAAGDLVSVLANKCVDIGGWNGNNGAQLIIWPCHGGSNQKWYTR